MPVPIAVLDLLLRGVPSEPTAVVGEAYFNGLRDRVRKAAKAGAPR